MLFTEQMASNRPHRSSQVCKKCQRPLRGHVGPTGSLCSQPSPQFVTDVPSSVVPADLANIQEELEASIRAHEDQIHNLSAELGSLRLNSTPSSVQQQANFAPTTMTVLPPGGLVSTFAATSSVPAVHTASTSSKMAAREIAASLSPLPVAPPQFASFGFPQTQQPQPLQPPVPASANTQVVSLLQQLLHHFQAPAAPVPQPSINFPPSCAPISISDLRQNAALKQQADRLLGAIPVLESGGAVSAGNQAMKGKSPGDLTFSAPVKVPQLWPHQFVCRLDSSNVAFKDLDLPQFVYGFIECLRQSVLSDQSKMLNHLSHLMDLASRFQWPAVRAYHARVLKAMEQGTATWDSDLYRFQTGLLLPSQEISSRPAVTPPSGGKKVSKEPICRDWNLSSCRQPCPLGRLHQCLICKVTDHKALVCPKHRCSPTCTWNHE